MLGDRALLPVHLEQAQTAERSLLTGRARRVKLAKVGMMYEQLADLLRAGVPLLRALTVHVGPVGVAGVGARAA
jgi:type II secretory pathway component PulF